MLPLIKRVLPIFLLLFSHLSLACTFSVRVTEAGAPYYYKDVDNQWKGMLIEFAELLGKEANCQPAFQSMPWARAMVQIKLGNLDMMMNLSRNPEREAFIDFVGHHHLEEMVFVTHKDAGFSLKHFSDVKKVQGGFGLADKVYYGSEFMSLLEQDPEFKQRFVYASIIGKHANITQKKRLNGFIQDRRSAAYDIKTNANYQSLKIYPTPENPLIVHSNPVYFGLSRQGTSPELKKKIQSAYKVLYQKSAFEQILKNYQ